MKPALRSEQHWGSSETRPDFPDGLSSKQRRREYCSVCTETCVGKIKREKEERKLKVQKINMLDLQRSDWEMGYILYIE